MGALILKPRDWLPAWPVRVRWSENTAIYSGDLLRKWDRFYHDTRDGARATGRLIPLHKVNAAISCPRDRYVAAAVTSVLSLLKASPDR